MGGCFSTVKVSGSNSNNTTAPTANHNRKQSTASSQSTTAPVKQEQRRTNRPNEMPRKQLANKPKGKPNSRRQTGVIPCGKRTDFGYDKNFDKRYTIGKLLGHGQFGYTYVATDKANGDRVAVKRIDKNKVLVSQFLNWVLCVFGSIRWKASVLWSHLVVCESGLIWF